jgi:beta-glucosidase
LLVDVMTLNEKLLLVSGQGGGPYNSNNRYDRIGIPRLGIPPFQAADGGLGVRAELPSTSFPAGLALASSWDTELGHSYGAAVGRETWLLGYSSMLGPVVDLARVPNYGRIFESFGEDPLLTG